jgi:hypothetical protein
LEAESEGRSVMPADRSQVVERLIVDCEHDPDFAPVARKLRELARQLEQVEAERDEAWQNGYEQGEKNRLNVIEDREKALREALRTVLSNSPWDVDQDCRWCDGHYDWHEASCPWLALHPQEGDTRGD